MCVAELRGLGAVHDELSRHGGSIVAISVDEPAQSLDVVEGQHLAFPILSDAKREVIRAYGLVHQGGGMTGEDVAIPSQFLLDSDRHVLWRRISARIQDRPSPDEVLSQVRKHFGGT